MKLDIVNNREIARRLSISESKAGRMVRTYKDAKALHKYAPVLWINFCEYYGIQVNQG